MLAFIGGMSAMATSFVFLGGALFGESHSLGLLLMSLGGGWLGILFGSLIRIASQERLRDA